MQTAEYEGVNSTNILWKLVYPNWMQKIPIYLAGINWRIQEPNPGELRVCM